MALQEEYSEKAGTKTGKHNGHPLCSESCPLGTMEVTRIPQPSSTQDLALSMAYRFRKFPPQWGNALRVLRSHPRGGAEKTWLETSWPPGQLCQHWQERIRSCGHSLPKVEVPASEVLFSCLGGGAPGSLGMQFKRASFPEGLAFLTSLSNWA